MKPDSFSASTTAKFLAFLGAFLAFPLLGLLCVFAERQRFISLSGPIYVAAFTAAPFVAFLFLAERFHFFPSGSPLQHLTCVLLALVAAFLCFWACVIAALIVFPAAASL
jgi:hypothetical protein